MFTIHNTQIRITRGDCASFTVDILQDMDDGSSVPYEMAPEDTLLFTAKRCLADTVPALQLRTEGTPEFRLRPEHTRHLLGRYLYDIELRTAGGNIYTVLGAGEYPTPEMEVLPEVTE